MRTTMIVAGIVLAIAGAGGVAASDTAGRFTMTPTDKGYLRLDTATGAVSICADSAGSWSCSAMPDDLASLTAEVDRLRSENRELKAKLESGPVALAPSTPPVPLELPSEADVDRAIGLVEKMVRRFKGLIEELHEDRDAAGTPL